MKFHIDDHFDATLAEFERLLDDPTLHERLAAAMPGLEKIELLERVEDAATIRRRLRFTPNTDGKIPAFGRSVIKPSMLSWIEESNFDKQRHRFDYRIFPQLPESWRDRFESHGTYALSSVSEGASGGVARRIEGEVVVRVPLLGRTVEKLLIREVTENFRAESLAMSAMLAAARHV